MANIKETAKAYEGKTTKNIADLEKVDVEIELEQRTYKEGTPDEYTVDVVVVDKEDYRVPAIVLKDLQTILLRFPNLKHFSVMKTGEGKTGTRYSVVPLGV